VPAKDDFILKKLALAYHSIGVEVANSQFIGLTPVTDVMISKIFSPKNWQKWRF
jgi:hypothetical protein